MPHDERAFRERPAARGVQTRGTRGSGNARREDGKAMVVRAEARAERRYKQLISKGNHASLAQILADIEARDARDMQRAAAPLKQCNDAMLLDTSMLNIDEAVQAVLQYYRQT